MSQERSNQKHSERREQERQSLRGKTSYTEEGFYRKANKNIGMALSNLSQKESIYESKSHQNNLQTAPDIGYSTLNPSKYGVGVTDLIDQQQYEVQAVFQLNRQREKNRILQQRLQNKEVHISKMNQLQHEMTQAFQKCQAQLQFYKKKCAQTVDVREYVEEINELKHLVIRLEDKINEYEIKESKRYSSVKQQHKENEENKNVSNFRVYNDSERQLSKREKRSKTVTNQKDSSPQFKKLNIIEEYVVKYPNRITNFISQFMAMVECFSPEAQNAKEGQDKSVTKKRLKIGWKWIKQVVVQWNHLKNYMERVMHFHNKLKKVFNIAEQLDDSQTMEAILHAISS